MNKICVLITALSLLCAASYSAVPIYNVKTFGAVGDGKTVNTKFIQRAINRCGQTGGVVVIPSGTFISGTLYMRSNVRLQVDTGGILKGSAFFKDYPDNIVKYKNVFTNDVNGMQHTNKALIFAEGVTNISFTGKGTIDGSGDSPEFDLGNDDTPQSRSRPCMLLIIDSKQIKLHDLHLRNSAYWLENYLGCDGLELKRLNIYNQSNYNQDGIDIDAKNVLIEECVIDVDDDGICFKSHDRNRIPRNIVVRNCRIATNCNAIKFGTTSIGGLEDVTISHCQISKASTDRIRHWQTKLKFIDQPVTVISGIAIEAVDGGTVEHVDISDINMKDVQTPLFIVLGDRGRRQVGDSTHVISKVKGIHISKVTAISHSKMTSSITAFPGYYMEDIQLNHIKIVNSGGGTLTDSDLPLIENSGAYPENRMYGEVYPACGLYIRHVKSIVITDLEVTNRHADYRPVLILDDTQNVRINEPKLTPPCGNSASFRIVSSRNVSIEKPVLTSWHQPLVEIADGEKEVPIITGFIPYPGWMIYKPIQ